MVQRSHESSSSSFLKQDVYESTLRNHLQNKGVIWESVWELWESNFWRAEKFFKEVNSQKVGVPIKNLEKIKRLKKAWLNSFYKDLNKIVKIYIQNQ